MGGGILILRGGTLWKLSRDYLTKSWKGPSWCWWFYFAPKHISSVINAFCCNDAIRDGDLLWASSSQTDKQKTTTAQKHFLLFPLQNGTLMKILMGTLKHCCTALLSLISQNNTHFNVNISLRFVHLLDVNCTHLHCRYFNSLLFALK